MVEYYQDSKSFESYHTIACNSFSMENINTHTNFIENLAKVDERYNQV